MDITVEEFLDFVIAASYLNIQGEYAERFAQNMVKYGLLGTHSADIVSSEDLYRYDLPQDTFRDILHAFLRQTGFAYRFTHPSTEQTMLRVEKADAWPMEVNKEYTGPSQTAKMRTVLYTELGPESSPERERNESVLVWLLLNMGGSSVDIQYTTDISSSEGIADLSQTIYNITKENEQGARLYVEGVTLKVNCRKSSFALHPALQLVPGLSRLDLSIDRNHYTSKEALSSLISEISSCQSLKALEITGYILESAEVSSLVESLPNIKQLSIWCKRLEGTAIDNLKKCVQLEKLEMDGLSQIRTTVQALLSQLPSLKKLAIKCDVLDTAAAEAFQAFILLEKLEMRGEEQPSAAVQALVIHLPALRDLSIECDVLDPAAARAFQACIQLEKLEMSGTNFSYQTSSIVQALISHLPSLKELTIWSKALEPAAAEAFQACTLLEKLEMRGEEQPSAAVQVLVTHLPSLRELTIWCESLDPAGAEAFQTLTQLEKLEMIGWPQPSVVVQALVSHLPSLRELIINCDVLDTAAAKAFQACTKLERLEMRGEEQLSTTVQALVSRLPSLRELSILCYILDPSGVEAFQACTRLEKLEMGGTNLSYQTSDVVQSLVRHLPSLKELTILCESLEPAAAEAFQACAQLEKLEIWEDEQPSVAVQALLRHLPSLKHLEIGIGRVDFALADALRNCPNLRSLTLKVEQYTPGFLARYLQSSRPRLSFLKLHNRDRNKKFSEEDKKAVEEAQKMGLSILVYSF
ncbi:hypothetical protein NECID01_2043 [Nematocida sp. AWRm77]|nr:hypothetical protein NECID01_2043 [Nematocida sp. AWRm77]